MSSVTQVIKSITLDLTDIPREHRKQAKSEASGYLKNEILRMVQSGDSPVEGEGRFRILNKDYAKEEKGGVRTSNLQLDGDLLDALKDHTHATTRIDMGVKGKEAPKADGHNQLSSEAKSWAAKIKYPKRRFIPDDNQKFKRSIMKGMDNILDEFRVKKDERVSEDAAPSSIQETPDTAVVTLDDIFSDQIAEALLAQSLARRKY